MSGTIDAIRREHADGGLIRRVCGDMDGFRDEGAFLACLCWLADCLYLRGDRCEARSQFERVLATANDVGLFAEECDVANGRLMGNFPLALTHMAVVKTALLLTGTTRGHRRKSAARART
ncbi:glycoside hydrolase family 15 protein [Paraburkholderia acidipaludis]|uniref:glycoside hydrolase family 15 protein n=1 Tax=Paraburkholderia acidipaludis TaxID=660537 RepID=UPI0012EB8D91|nr:glycoside hydrolase family 15 protein [Paraburkholderia acidipaludis]